MYAECALHEEENGEPGRDWWRSSHLGVRHKGWERRIDTDCSNDSKYSDNCLSETGIEGARCLLTAKEGFMEGQQMLFTV